MIFSTGTLPGVVGGPSRWRLAVFLSAGALQPDRDHRRSGSVTTPLIPTAGRSCSGAATRWLAAKSTSCSRQHTARRAGDVGYDPLEDRVDHYDLLVIGGGAAGINALKQGLKLGARVALVDPGPLGGTCINRG
jgi:NADPH-dependent 2,4-dienoyl-CoA reductase/sulfur reductase-like enzyme